MSRTGCNYSYKPEEIDDAMESLNFVNGPFVTQVPTNVMVQTTNIQVNSRPEVQSRKMTLRKAGIPADLALEGKSSWRGGFMEPEPGTGPLDGDCECNEWDNELNGVVNNAGYGLTAAELYAMEVWDATETALAADDYDNIPDLFDLESSIRTKLDTKRDATPAGKEWRSRENNITCKIKPAQVDKSGLHPKISGLFSKN